MRLGPLQELVLEGPRISKLLFKALSAYSGSLVKPSLHTVLWELLWPSPMIQSELSLRDLNKLRTTCPQLQWLAIEMRSAAERVNSSLGYLQMQANASKCK
jgi:hypothetical protein